MNWVRRNSSWFQKVTAILVMLLLVCIKNAGADESVRYLLVLNSYHHGMPWTIGFTEGLHKAASESSIEWQLYFENMDATRANAFDDSVYLTYLLTKYQGLRFDGVIADSEPATEFIKRNRGQLIAQAYVYYSDTPGHSPNGYAIGTRQSAYAEKTLEMAISQNPERNQIVLIESGTPPLENKETRIREYLEKYPNIKLSVRSSFYLDELLQEVAQYSDDTIVLYNLVFSDKSGSAYVPRDVVEKIANVSAVPVYGFYSPFLGTGIVGGHLNDATTVGRSTLAALSDYILEGKFSDSYPVTKSYLDASMAQRFGIDWSGLGPDTLVVNKPENWVVQNYQYILWGFGVFALLIVIGFIWATKLRVVNSRLTVLNEFLQDTQQELEVTNYNLKKQSMVDPLTGLLNRRAMLPLLREAAYECNRYQTESSLLLLDLDNFKSINDQFGHNSGDRVLELVSATLNRESRVSDSLARWGGEEFLILAKATPLSEVVPFAENIREKIESLCFDSKAKVTTSVGICIIRPDVSIDSLLAKADEAMYQAKKKGKNRIVVADNNIHG